MNLKSKSTLEKLQQNLSFKNYSDRTIEMYIHYAGIFLDSFNKDVYHISQNEAIKWLKNFNYSSVSQQNQIISAVKSLYKFVVGVKMKGFDIERPRKERKLPQIIDKNHLLNTINSITNIKHKAIIGLAYSVGLRVSEVINLKITDIDSKRMIIIIKNGKGNKDRFVPLSINILNILRSYYKLHKPKIYLFNGQNKLKYTASSCNKIVKRYLGENYHFHLLRHSCLTHLYEVGEDIKSIKELAGHTSIKTTEIYTHMSVDRLHKLKLAI